MRESYKETKVCGSECASSHTDECNNQFWIDESKPKCICLGGKGISTLLDDVLNSWGYDWEGFVSNSEKLIDKKFYDELTKSLDLALENLAKRKYDDRDNPPKDVDRCGKCKEPFYHVLDGWSTWASDYQECQKCDEGVV